MSQIRYRLSRVAAALTVGRKYRTHDSKTFAQQRQCDLTPQQNSALHVGTITIPDNGSVAISAACLFCRGGKYLALNVKQRDEDEVS